MYGQGVDGKMEFTHDEIKKGKLFDFVKVLMDNQCEIRMWTDGYCYIVEYLEKFRKEDGVEFSVIDDSQSDFDGQKDEEE